MTAALVCANEVYRKTSQSRQRLPNFHDKFDDIMKIFVRHIEGREEMSRPDVLPQRIAKEWLRHKA